MEPIKNNPFYKTKMCQAYRRGQCQSGDQCLWAHSYSELQRVDKIGIDDQRPVTSLCVFWKKGSCFMGRACRYAHTTAELTQFQPITKSKNNQPPPSPSPSPPSPSKGYSPASTTASSSCSNRQAFLVSSPLLLFSEDSPDSYNHKKDGKIGNQIYSSAENQIHQELKKLRKTAECWAIDRAFGSHPPTCRIDCCDGPFYQSQLNIWALSRVPGTRCSWPNIKGSEY